jgi:glyoxylase-like metal-dependent hydrolase (beta-lactamase superfamily II)
MHKKQTITAIAAAALAGGAYVSWKYIRYFTTVWKTTPTGNITDHLYAVQQGYVNMFVYTDGNHTIAFDAAMGGKQLQEEWKQLPVRPGAVSHLFLTHADKDHTAGLDLFPRATLYLPAAEEQMINGTTCRFPLLGVYSDPLPRPHTPLHDGDEVHINGITIQAIATPGHTPGHTAYLINKRILIAGDTLSLNNGRAEIFFPPFNMDTATQRQSIRKLAMLQGIEVLCSSHMGYTTNVAYAMQDWR